MSHWSNRSRYRSLIQNFVHGKIDGTEFENLFTQLWREDRDDSLSSTSSESKKICRHNEEETERLEQALSKIFTACDVFDPDPTTLTQYEYGEEELREFVSKLLDENSDLL